MNLLNEFLRNLLFLPQQASQWARELDYLHYFVFVTAMLGAWTTLATATVFVFRYRRKHAEQSTPIVDPKPIHEAVFIGLPLVLFLAYFAVGYPQYVRLQTPPKGAIDVYVQGKKWMWKFAYPGGPNSIDTLRVPANRPVRLLITSRDVIHSFFAPALRTKRDVVPGRDTRLAFVIDPADLPLGFGAATGAGSRGEAWLGLECAELCGWGHAAMVGRIHVLGDEALMDWLTARAEERTAED